MEKSSIIIVSFNVKEHLRKCLHSIHEYAPGREVIVVDNGSTDSSVEMVRTDFPWVILHEAKENLGFSRANNIGVGISKRPLVFLLNPDTELLEGGIDKLESFVYSNPTGQLAGPQLLNSDGSHQPSVFGFPTLKSLLSESFKLHRLTGNSALHASERSAPVPVKALSGAALMMPRKAYQELGGLDESLFWVEDVEICYRAHKHGMPVIYFPAVRIMHHGGKSSGRRRPLVIANQLLSRLKFFRKHKPQPVYWLTVVIVLFQVLSRMIVFFPLSFFASDSKSGLDAYLFTFSRLINYVLGRQTGIVK